ncbi:ABC-2 transporter permease [Amedibacterium intestinale]|uniref:Transporter n=1 Tax=Amedibacterium intestinale TaxID=2583452 RepID=A0A6N4TIK3_9FIRM|nr:ABC-2 transporter permease [Amedibacterium intestinale]RHO23065.1 ABC-2 transporter permease [Eubacterium sp. AM18-26]RHO28511.1 ABC-2 transporter permease [Eubacterium sp. AM18-10LB-B]BBK22314.1 transporter [Amedibacterium intestinale]
MKGLLIKDFKLIKMHRNYFAMIIAIAFVISLLTEDTTFMLGFISFITSMFTISTISYDEFDNGNAFLFTLPIDRKKYAAEKYVFGMLLGGCSLFLAIILAVILNLIEKSDTISNILISGGMLLPFILLLLSILIPFQLKFGSEKGRIVISAVFSIVFLISFVLGKSIGMLGINIAEVINRISLLGAGGLFILIFVISMIVVLFSMKVSISIMNKKEF